MHASEVYWRGQARTIQEAAEVWKEDYEEAQAILQFEASLDHSLATYEAFGKFSQAAWDDLFAGQLVRPLEAGGHFREMAGLLAQAFEGLLSAARGHERSGYGIARAGDLERAARDLRAREADFGDRWPRFDLEELKAILARPAEFVDAEEIYREFPELRRPDPA